VACGADRCNATLQLNNTEPATVAYWVKLALVDECGAGCAPTCAAPLLSLDWVACDRRRESKPDRLALVDMCSAKVRSRHSHLMLACCASGMHAYQKPAFYSDNYITLAPLEAMAVRLDWPAPLRNATRLQLSGWNAAARTLALQAALASS